MKKIKVWQLLLLIIVIIVIVAIIIAVKLTKKVNAEKQNQIMINEYRTRNIENLGLPIISGNLDNKSVNSYYYIDSDNDDANEIYNNAIDEMLKKDTIIFNELDMYEKTIERVCADLNNNVYLDEIHHNISPTTYNYKIYSKDYCTVYSYDDKKSEWKFESYDYNTDLSIKPYDFPLPDINNNYEVEEVVKDNEDEVCIIIKDVDYDLKYEIYIDNESGLITEIVNVGDLADLYWEVSYSDEEVKLQDSLIDYLENLKEEYSIK